MKDLKKGSLKQPCSLCIRESAEMNGQVDASYCGKHYFHEACLMKENVEKRIL